MTAAPDNAVMSPTDGALLQAVLEGDAAAARDFTELHRRHSRRLLGRARSRGFSDADTLDFEQSVWAKVWALRGRMDLRVDHVESYLLRVLDNTINDFLRAKQQRQRTGTQEATLDDVPEGQLSTDPDELPESQVDEAALQHVLASLESCRDRAFRVFLAKFPARAQIIELCVIQKLKGREVASIINRPYGATRQFLSESRKKWDEMLTSMCGDMAPRIGL